jgi:hypothetical protein
LFLNAVNNLIQSATVAAAALKKKPALKAKGHPCVRMPFLKEKSLYVI